MKTSITDRSRSSIALALTLALPALGLPGCQDGAPGEAGAAPPGVGSVVVTQWNDSTELFLEYPHPVAGRATGNWAIHLTELDVYAPVTEGRLVARFLSNGREVHRVTVDGPARDGIFLMDPVVEEPGSYRVELALGGPQVTSTHVLDPVEVYPSVAEAPAPAEEEGGGGIAFLKEQQWPLDFGVAEARPGELPRTLEVPGEIVPRDGGLAEVTAPLEAVARPEENADAPSVGDEVGPGDLLAVLSPVAGVGGYADLKGRVLRLERDVARARRLLDAGAVPERRLVEARHDLEVSRAELEAVGGDADGGYQLRLRAPIQGVVASRNFVPGGRVAAGSRLYRIVDPATLWLRARIPARASADVSTEPLPTFRVEGSDEVFTASRPVSVGSVLDPRTRTLPAFFEVPNPDRRLKVGQTATVRVAVGGAVAGVVVPASAVLDEDGVPVVYVEIGGETFERRLVEVGATDGRRSVLTRGVEPGEMVVSTGAYQVRLASLSGESFGAGHSH
ncbi:MAG: efflux RND transporter periplasmic adaptor subunit [Gemmatimonadetes bacterium]|nr:efflux RND transporter periplasmic adaptor subunit [Gemmatimonadota bacterium]NIR79325.1 efflux RND transporter periplasmic adaptor subunit [Gemmatimonadota bacterium]NIT87981.1 efflux RND transporter periplasmic adaptor subunit [Gemmatimonadota bacterium]NIU31832.1 efflux RND transporter periplasmic adaptor subunit [Gemmatimonadota bacterium]NIU36449.1 efflux RND transporter periplasmic adaptor subunit [Gemmatimonadota bacterium]